MIFGSRKDFACGSVWLCLLGLVGVPATPARACGVSGPDGVWSCSLAEHEEEVRPRWAVGVSSVFTWTALRFGDGLRADQTRGGILATAAYAPSPDLTLQLSAGATLVGALDLPNGEHRFEPGPLGAVGLGYRLRARAPFVVLSGVLSASTARTTHQGLPELAAQPALRYSAFDLRLGAAVGFTLWDSLRLYALGRVFGGPILWRYEGQARTGTDAYHVQLGAGASASIAERVRLFVEGVPLGERGIAGGAAAVF